MILERILCCDCSPGKIFKTNATFKSHLKTKKHLNFISNKDIKNYKKSSVEYENNITSQKLKIKEAEIKIKKLEKKNRLQHELNYFYLKNIILLIFFLNIKYSF
tara:strand:- start:579 stop:890 length:312 start_codon:yes stop_codon:yes gene_type:complete